MDAVPDIHPSPRRLAALLAPAGLLVAALAFWVRVSATEIARPALVVTALHVAAGVAFLVTGWLALRLRPRNNVGLLMTLVGLTWFVIDLQFLPSSVAFSLGNVFGIVTWAVVGHLALAFPSGRLSGAFDRSLIALGYAWTVAGNLATEVFFAPPPSPPSVPQQLLVLHFDAAQNRVANEVQLAGNILFGLAALAALLVHWRGASRLGRRALAPAVWSSLPIFAAVFALDAVGLVTFPRWLAEALPALTPIALMTLPVAFVVGLLRAGFARLALGPLVVELQRTAASDRLQDILARATGDPTLRVAYQLPGDGVWVDADGARVELPPPGAPRSFTLLERDGVTVAALLHDRGLDDDPALLASVAAAASLAVERERLTAEVRAQLAEVRASRARIVEAADLARRNLQRDLHDGAQQRLVAVLLRLSRTRERLDGDSTVASQLDEAREQLRLTLQELRELSSGIHPAILVEAGLGPALRSLADAAAIPVHVDSVPDRRLPDAVEAAAYFVVAESLANAAKHAQARAVHVDARRDGETLAVSVRDDGVGGADATRGSGISGLGDRVAALGGRMSVLSPPGGGTLVAAVLPCA